MASKDEKFPICAYCNQKYENPVVLPCKGLLCTKDVCSLASDDSLDCPICSENHPIPKSFFPIDSKILTIHEPKANFTKLNDLYKQFAELKQNPFILVEAHFNDIRNSINKFRNDNKKIIDDIFEQYITSLVEHERDAKNKISQILNPYPSDDDSNSSDYYRNKIDNLIANSDLNTEKTKIEAGKLEIKMEKKINDLKLRIAIKNPVVFKGKLLEKTELGKFQRQKLSQEKSFSVDGNDELFGNFCIALKDYDSAERDELSFKKGDVLVVKERCGNLWTASVKNSDKSGFVDPNNIAEIFNESWFFGQSTRDEAENFLKKETNKVGAFLVRFSSIGKTTDQLYSLSLKDKNDIKHYRIYRCLDANGVWEYWLCDWKKFKGLSNLIMSYTKRANGLCTELNHPCQKN
ncbi:unnamed protein product [Brachionus calyciflorus]|uniref:Uncharacterized protein n=1 Tax=Brachionus calyciflorus TaxID=104777 RepID=A0A814ITE2_9BILA|nr:unnamed protein product [Brachionus calyciflorus]